MIPEIKEQIDDILNPTFTEHKKWQLYEQCKQIVRNWEKLHTERGFSLSEYEEYVKYITDTLQI